MLEPDDSPYDFASIELQNFDQSLRCPICGDFFVGPTMIATCMHTFCAKCVQESMSTRISNSDRPRCPQCLHDANYGQLKRTNRIDEIVTAWKEARSTVLTLQATSAASTSRKGKGKARAEALADVDVSSSGDESNNGSAPSRAYGTRSRTQDGTAARPRSKDKARVGTTVKTEEQQDRIDDGESSDVIIVEEDGPKPRRKQAKRGDAKASSNVSQCPLCQVSFAASEIEAHAATCGTEASKAKAAWKSFMGSSSKASTSNDKGKTKPKSKLRSTNKSASPAEEDKPLILRDYSQIKQQKELESLLAASGLPTAVAPGQEKMATWKRRHARWTLLWNANVGLMPEDVNRKTPHKLRKELREWESTMDRQVKTVINPATHVTQYKDQFRTLTRSAAISSKSRPKAETSSNSPPAVILAPDSELDDSIPAVPARRAATPPPRARDSSPPPLEHSAASGDLSDSATSSAPSSPQLPASAFPSFGGGVPLSRKRSRSESPFDPEGPKPSQRVREEVYVEELHSEDSGTDGRGLGALTEEDEDGGMSS